jgi:hypothetical protein
MDLDITQIGLGFHMQRSRDRVGATMEEGMRRTPEAAAWGRYRETMREEAEDPGPGY